MEVTRKGFKEVTPVKLLNKVCTVTYLLEALLDTMPVEKKHPDTIESLFVFCLQWAFGGAMIADKAGDSRRAFHEAFVGTFGQRFPKDGQCFDYYYDYDTSSYVDWARQVPKYVPLTIGGGPSDIPFTELFVPTSDTVRLTFLINKLARKGKYAMLVGSGSGKTSISQQYLRSLDKDVDGFLSATINMSYYTDSRKIQQELELPIDKRSGKRYGPPATKRLIYFIDEMNLPYVETYGTQNAIALLTQHMQYGTIFDRNDLGLRKEIVDVQYLAAMNPTAGSFTICERAQRHFATFACLSPSRQDLSTIYGSILHGHLQGFNTPVVDFSEKIVEASLSLLNQR